MIQILKAVDLCRVHRPGKDLQDYVQEASFNSVSYNWVNLFLFLAGTHICFSTLYSCSQVVTLSQSMILNMFFGRVIWWQLKLLSFYVFFSFLLIALELTTWPANNCLETSVAANNILLMRNRNTLLCENVRSFPRAGRESFDLFSWSKQWWSNDETIVIELGYYKISWFVSVLQINNLPQAAASANNNWSAHHLQITVFCSTLLNNC